MTQIKRTNRLSLLVIIAGAIITAGAIFGLSLWQKQQKITTYRINNNEVHLILAETQAQQERGLGGRCALTENYGMLFPYSSPSHPVFWMKGMRFSIDLLWVRDHKIIGLEQNMPTDNGKKTYPAPDLVDEVVELPAGWVKQHNVNIGDSVAPTLIN